MSRQDTSSEKEIKEFRLKHDLWIGVHFFSVGDGDNIDTESQLCETLQKMTSVVVLTRSVWTFFTVFN